MYYKIVNLFVLFLLISTMHATRNSSKHGTQRSSNQRLLVKKGGGGEITMFVRMPSGETRAINVPVDATVGDVIDQWKLQYVPSQRLSFAGRTLDGFHRDDLLVDAGISAESVLTVVDHDGPFEYNPDFKFDEKSATLRGDRAFGVICLARKVRNGERCHAIITFDEHAQMQYAIKDVDERGQGVSSVFNAKSLRINVDASGEEFELDGLASEGRVGESMQRHGSLNKSDLGIEICIRIPEDVTITVEWNDGLKEDDAEHEFVGSFPISGTVKYIDKCMQSGK